MSFPAFDLAHKIRFRTHKICMDEFSRKRSGSTAGRLEFTVKCILPVVVPSEFRMRQRRDDDQEDTPHFRKNIWIRFPEFV